MNDKSEAMSWLKKAEDDLLHARLSMDGKSYDWATLASQQVAEKSLKALFLFKGNELIKTHDLTFFGRKLNASREILVHCGLLNPFYTTSRYPDELIKIDKIVAKDVIIAAGEILEWCQKQIKI